MVDYNLSAFGSVIEMGGISGMILTFPDAQPFNTAGYLFAASCAVYGLGKHLSFLSLKKEIKIEIREEREELSDKL